MPSECTALDIRRPTLREVHFPRRYRCCDPACPGYPKGHHHRETCATAEHYPIGWRRGIVRSHMSRAANSLFLAEQVCRDPDVLAIIQAARKVLEIHYAR